MNDVVRSLRSHKKVLERVQNLELELDAWRWCQQQRSQARASWTLRRRRRRYDMWLGRRRGYVLGRRKTELTTSKIAAAAA